MHEKRHVLRRFTPCHAERLFWFSSNDIESESRNKPLKNKFFLEKELIHYSLIINFTIGK